MILSLNEVEALAKKATRGVGYPWGLAEEAAKATRWLCERGEDGCGHLAALLQQRDGTGLADWSPVINDGTWKPPESRLCPIMTGAALSDCADDLRAGDLRIEWVARPILLLPFAGMSASYLKAPIELTWGRVVLCTDGAGLSIHGRPGELADCVTVRIGSDVLQAAPRRTRAEVSSADFEVLNRFAHRTYAPATEESRQKGAGAGLSDND